MAETAFPANDAEALERGRRLFAGACDFLLGAARLSQLPETDLPEIAFAGRSNVGKSSLINALTGRKALARTSNTPGRTQEINFFELGGRLMMADLPGYGFAKAPKARVDAWTELIELYLKGRRPLRRVALLIDARRGVMAGDESAMQVMDAAAVNFQIVLTKCDKLKPGPLARLIADTRGNAKTHVAAHPEILATSSVSGDGLAELRAELAALALPPALG